MRSCPSCSSSNLTRDGHDQRGRSIHACGACGRHATAESTSLVLGHRFPRDIILLAVRYYLQLGASAERIAGILADRGIDVSGRTSLRGSLATAWGFGQSCVPVGLDANL
jgi:transposase-like protein